MPSPPSQHRPDLLHVPQAGADRRRNSTDSLRPSVSNNEASGRRKLLLIYVHGFQGDESSFRAFPAHVHNTLASLLSDTHVVHTKIYPRYRSKEHITVARDHFSRWCEHTHPVSSRRPPADEHARLAPHETSTTDVVLLGHSMGGLLCAEVVLKLAESNSALCHRIVGTINFDVPFLGMHPGVIKTGLASIFAPAHDQPQDPSPYLDTSAQSSTSAFGTSPSPLASTEGLPAKLDDPNYNPSFDNDVILPVRKGWRNVLHFVNKHSDHLYRGTKRLVTSHLEFGSAMADYKGLKARYARIRSLDVPFDEVRRSIVGDQFVPPRVRFVNYYTASTGRSKREKSPKPDDKDGNGEITDKAGERGRSTSREPSSQTSSSDNDEIPTQAMDDLHLTSTNTSAPPPPTQSSSSPQSSPKPGRDAPCAPTSEADEKPKKDRKFCTLPPRDSTGNRDPAWVRVFMADMDEVTAHCGLFFDTSPAYATLVLDVADRVRDWVGEEGSERLARSLAEE